MFSREFISIYFEKPIFNPACTARRQSQFRAKTPTLKFSVKNYM
jgi:hypothetical protein